MLLCALSTKDVLTPLLTAKNQMQKTLKEISLTLRVIASLIGRASVIVVPLILILNGSWAWAIVFVILWLIVFGLLDAI